VSKVKTSIEVDRDIWAKVRGEAFEKEKSNSQIVEDALREYFSKKGGIE